MHSGGINVASKVCVTPKVRKWCMKSPLPCNYSTLIISKDMPGDRCAIQGPRWVENGGKKEPHTVVSHEGRLMLNNANTPQGAVVWGNRPPKSHLGRTLSYTMVLSPYGVNNAAGWMHGRRVGPQRSLDLGLYGEPSQGGRHWQFTHWWWGLH